MTLNQFLTKYKRVIIFILVIVITTFVYNTLSSMQKNVQKKVENYVKYNGFKLDDDKVLYKKEIESMKAVYDVDKKNNVNTSYEALYFDVYSYNLIDNLSIYKDGVEMNYIASKDWKEDVINYTFTSYYLDSNIVVTGTYNENDFTCNIDYSHENTIYNTTDFCEDIKYYSKNFDKLITKTFRSMKIINYMKNKEEE